jgi:hypothetical protein
MMVQFSMKIQTGSVIYFGNTYVVNREYKFCSNSASSFMYKYAINMYMPPALRYNYFSIRNPLT